MQRYFFLQVLLLLLNHFLLPVSSTVPSWEELDQRPLPKWYSDAKFGIFLHWGVFSVPSYGSEWFQLYWQASKAENYVHFINTTQRPNFAYSEFARDFRAELYHPEAWAQAFAQAGAQYVVLTSKHHEGFAMWDSRDIPTTWQWNVMDVGPRRDVLGDLAKAVRKVTSPMTNKPIQFGVYHSLYEWFNPFFQQDEASQFRTSNFVQQKTLPELYDLVKKYQPTFLWSDGGWDAHSDYWQAREFLDWYSTKSSVASQAVWNDRWGNDTMCTHGSVLTCADRYDPGKALQRYWEKCLSMDQTSWGFNRNATLENYLTTAQLVHELVETVSRNGNLLLNIGPAADGSLPAIFLDRLRGMGKWLKVNGESIYGSTTWPLGSNETAASGVFYTYNKSGTLYVHMTLWPTEQFVVLTCVPPPMLLQQQVEDKNNNHHLPKENSNDNDSNALVIRMLGVPDEDLVWERTAQGHLKIHLPALTPDRIPCEHSWVLALSPINNDRAIQQGQDHHLRIAR